MTVGLVGLDKLIGLAFYWTAFPYILDKFARNHDIQGYLIGLGILVGIQAAFSLTVWTAFIIIGGDILQLGATTEVLRAAGHWLRENAKPVVIAWIVWRSSRILAGPRLFGLTELQMVSACVLVVGIPALVILWVHTFAAVQRPALVLSGTCRHAWHQARRIRMCFGARIVLPPRLKWACEVFFFAWQCSPPVAVLFIARMLGLSVIEKVPTVFAYWLMGQCIVISTVWWLMYSLVLLKLIGPVQPYILQGLRFVLIG